MSLSSVLRQAAREAPAADPRQLAVALLRRLTKEQLVGLLAEEIAHQQRSVVHSVEESSPLREFFARSPAVLRRRPLTESLDAFRPLFGQPVRLGDGMGTVRWENVTCEQRERRIAMLEGLRDGLDRTLNREREALRLCREHGVDTLAELEAMAHA